MNSQLSRIAAAFLLMAGVIFVAIETVRAQQPSDETMVRELYVPFSGLDALLGEDTNRVFMSRQEFETMKESAKQSPEVDLPLDLALLSANYVADIREGRAVVQGTMQIDVLKSGLHAVPLEFQNVGIRVATLDGDPARLGKDQSGTVFLFIEGVGKHRLEVELMMPVRTDAAQQTVSFQVPTAPSSRIDLSVPGNVEIKSGASIIGREVDQEADLTRFQIVPSPGPMEITMSLNNRRQRENNTVMARGVIVSEVTKAYERLHASMSMSVVNGATDELRFVVDPDLDVDRVECELLSRWEIDATGDQKVLVVKLRTPATDRVVVNVRMDRGSPRMSDWSMPGFGPENVAGYSAVVGLVIEDRLRAAQIRSDSLFTIDSEVLMGGVADRLFVAEPGAPSVQAIAAYYAPSAEYELNAEIREPANSLTGELDTLFSFSDSGVELTGTFYLSPEQEELFAFDFVLPQDWNLQWVKRADQSDLEFQRNVEADGTRIRVLIPSGLAVDESHTLLIKADWTPATWLGQWDQQTIDLPKIQVSGIDGQSGVIAVSTADDLLARPTVATNLIVLGQSDVGNSGQVGAPMVLKYRYQGDDWQSSLELTRVQPRQTARVLTFVRIDTDSLGVHSELIYLVDQARTNTLRLSLAESTPAEISIRASGSTKIKESTSAVVDGRRLWTVSLADKSVGSVRLIVDFVQQLESQEIEGAELPVVRAEDVQYQTGAIAVEGHSELETTIVESPRTIDIGELVDAEYQVGKRLVGVYGYVANNDRVVVDILRRPIHGLPSTIVQRSEVVTQISAQGRCQSVARFQFRTKATLIECRFSDDANLWSAILDGKPALPQRINDRTLIAIPASGSSTTRDLQLVYETPSAKVGLRGDVVVQVPELLERADDDTPGILIPVADLDWRLILPSGYRAVRSDGRAIDLRTDAALSFWESLSVLGGTADYGIGAIASGVDETSDMDGSDKQIGYAVPSQMMDNLELALPPSATNGMEFEEEMAPQSRSATTMGGVDFRGFRATFEDGPAEPSSAPLAALAEAEESKESPRETRSAKQDAGKIRTSKRQVWALEGVRSLDISLSEDSFGQAVHVTGLGSRTKTRLTVIDQRRVNWIALAVGLVLVIIGFVQRTWTARIRLIFLSALTVLLLPNLLGMGQELASLQFTVLCALVALMFYYLLVSLFRSVSERWIESSGQKRRHTPTIKSTVAVLLALCCLSSTGPSAYGQQPDALKGIPGEANLNQINELLKRLSIEGAKERLPVSIPENAVVIPYDPDRRDARRADTEKLLVPYQTYQRLWNLANPEQSQQDVIPPAAFAWSDVRYNAMLDDSGTLTMDGTLTLEQFAEGHLAIPLALSGCVIEKALLDGQPAKLNLIVASKLEIQSQQKAAASSDGMLVLHTSGKGSKSLELRLRMQLRKSGGWRIVQGRVPSAPACAMAVQVEAASTEVRFAGMLDRSTFESAKANEVIETGLAASGEFSIQWRDKISEAKIDQGLTAETKAVFDLREDACRLAWHVDLEFRRGRRESFSCLLPKDYLIEKVLGKNVRGWNAKLTDQGQRLDIELLKAALERESFSVILSKQQVIGEGGAADLEVPNLVVPDAMLQQGRVTVRKSALLNLRTGATEGLTRINVPDESGWFATFDEPGPLPVTSFQSYRYSQTGYSLPLEASTIPTKKSVEVQSVVRLSQRETQLESRLLITANERPLYKLQVRLPAELDLNPPKLAGKFQWAVTVEEDGSQRLEIDLADGVSGQFPVLLDGTLPAVAGDASPDQPAILGLPELEVIDADQQFGTIAIQIDPAFDVRLTNLAGCESALLNSVNGWLKGRQRQLARAAVRYDEPGYSGQIRVTPRVAAVRSLAITNVKVTDRAVEETIFLEATISSAGISEYVFLLPASMAGSRIQAPLIRQKSLTPVNDSPGAPLRVVLELQDSIMGKFAVIVQNDRLLGNGAQAAPIPSIETGETVSRLVTLENASRDELMTEDVVLIESLDRSELSKSGRLDRLGGKSSMVFRVREGDGEDRQPRLTFKTQTRETIQTSGARIGLAQTLLIVDEYGAFRGQVEYRVENRTEPFLEVALPNGARLWTVQVAGVNVKPSTSAGSPDNVRIPLIKTAEGDLDYPVILKYGGDMDQLPTTLEKVDFPLVKTVNLNVELSQVRLRLPSQMRWFAFDGTMGRVQTESDLQAGWLSYRTKQIAELTEMLSSSRGKYSKVRAQMNLKQLYSSVGNDHYASDIGGEGMVEGEQLRRQRESSAAVLDQAKQQIVEFENQSAKTEVQFDNRSTLDEFYLSQSNDRTLNVASGLGLNFPQSQQPSAPSKGQKVEADAATNGRRFDTNWLSRSELSVPQEKAKAESRIVKRLSEVKSGQKAKKALQKQSADRFKAPQQGQAAARGQQLQRDKFTQQQIAGDYVAQAERYRQQLERQSSSRADYGYSSMQGTNTPQSRMPSSGIAGDISTATGFDGVAGLPDKDLDVAQGKNQPMEGMSMGGGGFGGGGGRALGMQMAQQGSQPGALQNQFGELASATATPKSEEAFLASLEVELAVRGTEYMFTTPGGDLQLSARCVTAETERRSQSLLMIAVGALIVMIGYRWFARRVRSGRSCTPIVVAMAIVGIVSIVSGTLPVYGVLIILAAMALYFETSQFVAAKGHA